MSIDIHPANRALFEAEDQLLRFEAAMDRAVGLIQKEHLDNRIRHKPNPGLTALGRQYRNMRIRRRDYELQVIHARAQADEIK